MHELVVKCCCVFRGAEVSVFHSPIADGLGNAGDQLADSGFTLGSADLSMKIF